MVARMHYRELAWTGPIGSVNAASSGRDSSGVTMPSKHLCALQEAWRNGHWKELWNFPIPPR